MQPSSTCHTTRAILRNLGSNIKTDHNGLYVNPPEQPDVWQSTDDFRSEWLAYNVARKRELDLPETEEAAHAAFKATERECLRIETDGLLNGLCSTDLRYFLRARQICHDVLGEAPPDDWYRHCEFTGGASTSRKRSRSHPAMKWYASEPLHVTPLALQHLFNFMKTSEVIDTAWGLPGCLSVTTLDHRRSNLFYKIVPGSKLQFVEKNYKTKRAILLEPDGNMLLQKGVGTLIRKCLRRVGINLNSQRLNQALARIGSITGTLCTLDLSAASDSVTLMLLRFLLPWKWYSLIYEIRSHLYNDNGTWCKMHKVSSMGNGFTFELESLVFYALSQAVIDIDRPVDTRVAIFGDDIIVASEVCARLIKTLHQAGFSINSEKSFWSGPFRESCGKHYHSGADVTPVYIKGDLDLAQTYRLYNQVRLWAGGVHFDPRFTPMLDSILSTIPVKDRCQVPIEYSSVVGLYFPDVCSQPIKAVNTHKGNYISFSVWDASQDDITDRYEDGVAWLYRHMSHWRASCPLGITEYTPLVFKTEGAKVRRKVSIPYAAVSELIA